MFLTESKFWAIVKKQFFYKLKAYRGVYTSMMMLQIIGIFFSLNGIVSMSGGSSESISYEINGYSSNLIIVFMLIWAIITSIIITTKAYRFDDFSFVANRLTSHLSNILFLLASSILAGVTSFLDEYLLKVLVFFTKNSAIVVGPPPSILITIIGLLATILYIFLFCSVGYVCGMLVQINKLFLILIPVLPIGTLILASKITDQSYSLVEVATFFIGETSFVTFIFKIGIVVISFFGIITIITNRLEVRQ